MKTLGRLAILSLGILACARATSVGQTNDGWIPLFDGQTLSGWRVNENPATFSVANGEIVVHGPTAHMFYDGPVLNHHFTNYEFKADVLTKPGANSGIYMRTAYQPTDWPSNGYEVQVNNSHTDWRRTGSLYAVRDIRESMKDNEWFTLHTIVQGRRVQIFINERQVVDYTEPDTSKTRLTGNTIALQGHDPNSEVHYRNIFIKPLSP